MTRRIFVSYRRQDAAVHAGYLAQTLMSLGAGEVFLDVEEMQLGEDFVRRIHLEVGRCDVLMVLMGNDWLGAPDADGRNRLWDPLDWVHVEIRAALDRQIPVIPLLVGGASMPQPEQLPEPLRPLAFRHGRSLDDTNWRDDVAQLVARLPPVRTPEESEQPPASGRPLDAAASKPGEMGWTTQAAAELLVRLRAGSGRVQARVIELEAAGDGTCDRATVYLEARRDPDRSLKGFTRAVGKAMREMQAEGLLPREAADPMEPVYDGADGTQRAQGFRMPRGLVPVFAAASTAASRAAALPPQPAIPARPSHDLQDPLGDLRATPPVDSLVRRVAASRSVVLNRSGNYVSVAPSDGRGIALYAHRALVSVAMPPERADGVLARLPGVELQPKTPATTYVLIRGDLIESSPDRALELALEAVDWRTR